MEKLFHSQDIQIFVFLTIPRKNSKHFLPPQNGGKKTQYRMKLNLICDILALISIECLFFIELSLEK